MKFLKTIRFDPSDTHVFESAAPSDEWAIPGGFSFGGMNENNITGKLKQAFSNGFLSIESYGFSTFVSVAEIDQVEADGLKNNLASHFMANFGAPSKQEALRAANSEIDFVLEMCARVAINSIFALQRFFDDDGEIKEEFRIVDAPGAKPHARVWEVVEE